MYRTDVVFDQSQSAETSNGNWVTIASGCRQADKGCEPIGLDLIVINGDGKQISAHTVRAADPSDQYGLAGTSGESLVIEVAQNSIGGTPGEDIGSTRSATYTSEFIVIDIRTGDVTTLPWKPEPLTYQPSSEGEGAEAPTLPPRRTTCVGDGLLYHLQAPAQRSDGPYRLTSVPIDGESDPTTTTLNGTKPGGEIICSDGEPARLFVVEPNAATAYDLDRGEIGTPSSVGWPGAIMGTSGTGATRTLITANEPVGSDHDEILKLFVYGEGRWSEMNSPRSGGDGAWLTTDRTLLLLRTSDTIETWGLR